MTNVLLSSTIMRSPDQVFTDLGGEIVILSLRSPEYCGLEAVGAHIWNIIQEQKTVEEILNTLLHDYDVEPDRCKRDLLAIIEELANEGLVEVKNEAVC